MKAIKLCAALKNTAIVGGGVYDDGKAKYVKTRCVDSSSDPFARINKIGYASVFLCTGARGWEQ